MNGGRWKVEGDKVMGLVLDRPTRVRERARVLRVGSVADR